MKRDFVTAVICAIAMNQGLLVAAGAQKPDPPSVPNESALNVGSSHGEVSTLPPPPRGKSTVLGGEIRSVDPVRDEFALRVFGKHPVKILFDERTQVFRDGKRVALKELAPSSHASIESVLDGTDVYALSIHLLSQPPEGMDRGQVMTYDPNTHELTLRSSLVEQPIKMIVPDNVLVTQSGRSAKDQLNSARSALEAGSLVAVTFQVDNKRRPVAQSISVLASPGSESVFSGNITALDTRSGSLLLLDPRDGSSYQLDFDSARLPVVRNLHIGDHVIANATFDGERYTATVITIKN